MGLLKLIHHLLNPHCPDCLNERHESKICQSCETLEKQLEISNFEKRELLNKLLKEPEPIVPTELPKAYTMPKTIPWRVRQQMLEREDREKARLMRQAPLPDSTNKIEELERELGVSDVDKDSEATHQDAKT